MQTGLKVLGGALAASAAIGWPIYNSTSRREEAYSKGRQTLAWQRSYVTQTYFLPEVVEQLRRARLVPDGVEPQVVDTPIRLDQAEQISGRLIYPSTAIYKSREDMGEYRLMSEYTDRGTTPTHLHFEGSIPVKTWSSSTSPIKDLSASNDVVEPGLAPEIFNPLPSHFSIQNNQVSLGPIHDGRRRLLVDFAYPLAGSEPIQLNEANFRFVYISVARATKLISKSVLPGVTITLDPPTSGNNLREEDARRFGLLGGYLYSGKIRIGTIRFERSAPEMRVYIEFDSPEGRALWKWHTHDDVIQAPKDLPIDGDIQVHTSTRSNNENVDVSITYRLRNGE